jgi:hypothetical protein
LLAEITATCEFPQVANSCFAGRLESPLLDCNPACFSPIRMVALQNAYLADRTIGIGIGNETNPDITDYPRP